MKELLFIILATFSAHSFSKAVFQQSSGELTWIYAQNLKDWGKTDPSQVTLDCDDQQGHVRWSNARTLKLILKRPLAPGTNCVATALGEKYPFTVPRLKIEQVAPWDFQKLDEDSSFVVTLNQEADPEKLARQSYVEVEGLAEKIELDVVSGDLRNAVLKALWIKDGTKSVVLQPRRTFPLQKSIVFVIEKGITEGFRQQGKIREPFKLTISCERENAEAPCSPLGKINLEFNSDVKANDIKRIALVAGKESRSPVFSEEAATTSFAQSNLQLNPESEYVLQVPAGLKDSDGRELSNADKFPLKIRTAAFPPLAKFPGAFGILEALDGPVLPVTVRNIEREVSLTKTMAVLKLKDPVLVMQWQQAINRRQHMGYEKDLRHTSVFEGSKIRSTNENLKYGALKNESEVLGLPLKEKGFHIIELSSEILGKSLLPGQKKFYISTAVLVTNLVAHLKIGEKNSLVWVTNLKDGRPVAQAKVSLSDCQGKVLARGKSDKKGLLLFSSVTRKNLECVSKNELFSGKLMAIASLGDDATFTMSDWSEGIEPWRFSLPYYGSETDLRGHTVFDRPVYKVGEKVHMLHLLRNQGDQGLLIPALKPGELFIEHLESGKSWTLPLKWKALGNANTIFPIPDTAPQGQFFVSYREKQNDQVITTIPAGSFMVKEFRVPLMRSEIQFQDGKDAYVQGENIKLLGHLEFLAGGSSSDTPVTLRAELYPQRYLHLKEWEDYSFRPGRAHDEKEEKGPAIEKLKVKTDAKGDFTFALKALPNSDKIQSLLAEVEYMDPNGIFQTNTVETRIYPHKNLIGFLPVQDLQVRTAMEIGIVVVDSNHKKLVGVSYNGILYRQITNTTRKKILGGFYTYDSTRSLEKVGKVCSGKTDEKGKAICTLTVNAGGSYFLEIHADGAVGTTEFYAFGDQTAWNHQDYHDRMDLIPNMKDYLPGDVASLEMKLPFEKGTVLITKERKGIGSAWIAEYNRRDPFIHVPITEEDYPNTYISALIVRGRLSGSQASGTVDLGKPAYRLGIAELKVNKKNQDFIVNLVPEKDAYQVRSRVRLKVKVITPDGSAVKNSKVAISVFDKGLLQFGRQSSFDVVSSMFQDSPHSIITATAQTHVIGKRHFGLKARPHGGGGGKDFKPRELFETLLYWNPEVSLNSKGEALVEFQLNDALTAFSIHALAYDKVRFGAGMAEVRSTQDVMTFVATASSIRAGDEFEAKYTLKNITSNALDLRAVLLLNERVIKDVKLSLASGSSAELQQKIPPFKDPGKAHYSLRLYDGPKKIDEIKTTQLVLPTMTPEVRYSDLRPVNPTAEVAPVTSEDPLAALQVNLSASLMPGNAPLRDFMRTYQYQCLEQKIARAIIMDDRPLKRKIERELPAYIDDRGLLRYYPGERAQGQVALTSHILEVAHLNGWHLPQKPSLEKALVTYANGETKHLAKWELDNFEKLKLRVLSALKLTNSSHWKPVFEVEVAPPSVTDDVETLLQKWVIFHPGDQALLAQDLIKDQLKIDGVQIDLNAGTQNFLRLLLIQKLKPSKSKLNELYRREEGKFLRGLLSHRYQGHFGETMSNTLAYLLNTKMSHAAVTGKTTFAGQSKTWIKDELPSFNVPATQAKHSQSIEHKGRGTPWADIRYLFYPDTKSAQFRGIELSQTLKKINGEGDYSVQDRVEVTINIVTTEDRTLIGMRVSLPAGVTILTAEATHLNYEERTELEWRGYFDHLPKGSHTVKVIFRLNQAGSFQIPGTRVEALYSPEVSGTLPHWKMQIK